MMRTRWLAACLALAAGPIAAGGETASATGGTLVLDENAYWRYYVRFGVDRLDAKVLKDEADQLLGRRNLGRLAKTVRRWSAPPYAEKATDFSKVDWRDHAPFFVTQVANCGCNDERISLNARSDPPPADWMKPDSPARRWQRQRLPLLVGDIPSRGIGHGVGEMKQPLVRGGYFRTRFDVPDPGTAGTYTLHLTFRGGVRVFVNGRELTRSHLPDGPIGPDALAESYPKAAYLCLEGEASSRYVERKARRVGSGFVPYCPDLPGDIEAAFRPHRGKPVEYYRGLVNRACWRRVKRLRDRTVGPIEVPRRLLRAGGNLLAVEVRPAPLHPIVAAAPRMAWGRSYWMGADFTWAHARLLGVELRCDDAEAPSALERPSGVSVWVEDPHRRLYADDFGRPAEGGPAIRLLAPANATCAAQLAVSSDRELTGLKVSPTPLKRAGGGEVPAAAVSVGGLAGHPVSGMIKLGHWRGLPEIVNNPVCPTSWMALLRHGPEVVRRSAAPPPAETVRLMQGLKYYDHIRPAPPARVPAGTCRGLWVSVRVPPDAAAGTYRGNVEVAADGMKPVRVGLEVEVMGWRSPDARRFQSFFAGEASPYGVAEQYGVRLWSDEHFRLMEDSFRQLARLGSRWVFVPVIQYTEFGNLTDSMVRWVRRRDGELGLDLSVLRRYLDLAVKHLGRELVVCFVVAHGTHAGAKATVNALDERTGKTTTLDLSKASPTYARDWKHFATTVYEFMKARRLADGLYWGYGWDGIGDADLIPLFARAVPEAVRWARGSHAPNRAPGGWGHAFTASSFIYSVPITERSLRGWRRSELFLLNPRAGCSVVSANGHSPPFAYRMLMPRALVAGCRGLARIGADYWAGVFYRGYEGRAWAGSLPGMGCLSLLWPGPEGAQPSQRGEMLLEGIQEGEARIFLEQCLARGALPGPLARRAEKVLDDHHRETLYFPVGRVGVQIQEYAAGWQGRSRRLYSAAAAAAEAVPLDVDRTELTADVPARGRRRLHLTVRNWTARPRAWKAVADKAWIRPVTSAGELSGHERLALDVDTTALTPGETAEATVTVTDAARAGGTAGAWPVKVAVRVGPVFELAIGQAYDFLGKPGHASSFGPRRVADSATFNVTAGGSEGRSFVFINHSGSPLTYRIAAPVPWLKVSPSSGTLPPGARTDVTVTAAPPGKAAARHELTLTVAEADGPARQEAALIVHAIPPYAEPDAPGGKTVPLASLPKSSLKAHKSRAYWYGTSDPGRNDYGPKFDEKGNIVGGTPQLTVYDVAGEGYRAFSAKVRVNPRRRRVGESSAQKVVNFEVHVDGRLRAQSGLMTAADAPRLLVADGLAGAKEVKLLVRWDRPEPKYLGGTVGTAWIDPRFHR